eukprot:6457131-Prymnesium_polylepis.1
MRVAASCVRSLCARFCALVVPGGGRVERTLCERQRPDAEPRSTQHTKQLKSPHAPLFLLRRAQIMSTRSTNHVEHMARPSHAHAPRAGDDGEQLEARAAHAPRGRDGCVARRQE